MKTLPLGTQTFAKIVENLYSYKKYLPPIGNRLVPLCLLILLCSLANAQDGSVGLVFEEFSSLSSNGRVTLLDDKDFSDKSLEEDFIRIAAKDYSETEFELYYSKCQLVRSVADLYVKRPDLNRKDFKVLRKEFLVPHNYDCQYRKYRKEIVWSDKKATEYKNFLAENYPEVLDSLFVTNYNKDKQAFRTQLLGKDVGDFIYALGLMDSRKSVPLFEDIASGARSDYSKSDREKAQMALARMGIGNWESYLLDSIFDSFNIDVGIGMCSYICSQKSAYKYAEILRDQSDGMFYGPGPHMKKVAVYRNLGKGRCEVDSVELGIFYDAFPKRYKVVRYLVFSRGNRLFENVSFCKLFENEIEISGRKFEDLSQTTIEEMVSKVSEWLDENKGNYILNRQCLMDK